MQIYTIHSNSDEDEARIGIDYGFFTDESAVIDIVHELEEQAQDPDDYEYSVYAQFWYNAYSPNETADDIGIRPSAG